MGTSHKRSRRLTPRLRKRAISEWKLVKDGKLLGWAKALFTRHVEFHGTRTNERDNRVVAHAAHTKNILAPGEDSVGPYMGAWVPCCSCDKASIPFGEVPYYSKPLLTSHIMPTVRTELIVLFNLSIATSALFAGRS